MAFDHNSIPMNLRPVNTSRTLVDDSRIGPIPVTTTSGRNIEGFYAANPSRDHHPGSPSAVPLYHPATVSDSGFVGLGYGNAPGVGGVWVQQRMPPPPPAVLEASVGTSPAVVPTTGFGNSPKLGNRLGGNSSDQASDESRDDLVSVKKVKLLCSFGGKIMPRPNDGALRYVGGDTKIISLRRNVSFTELVQKMTDSYGQNVVIKYQLPDEDLDALVSVSSPDDLVNMLDEYDRLVERSPDGSAKLRIFLFSTTEGDSSAAVQMGISKGNGQRYIEAVNGIVDGTIDGITRRESMASGTSTQNSDLSGTEAIDSTGHGQMDVAGTPSTGGVSPKNNFFASQEVAPRLVYVDPNPPMHVEAATAPAGIQMVGAHPPALSTRPSSVVQPQQSVVQPQQQQQMGFQPRPPYFQAYADPQQVLSRPEYVQYPSQMGYPSQLLGTVMPVFPQQQYYNNVANVTPHQQFIPAVHMSMTPSSYANLRPTAVQPIVQHQQVQVEHFPEENKYGQRLIQLPGDQNYNFNAYHAQVSQSPIMPGSFGWHQAPQTEQVPLSDSLVPQQQTALAEKLPRFEECYMCQKALPHAHSDTVAQGQRESPKTTSDFSSSYHSLQTDDKTRVQPFSTAALTGPMGEGIVENQYTGEQMTPVGHLDHEGRKPAYIAVPVPQYVDEKTSLQRENNHDRLQTSLLQCVGSGSLAPDSGFMGTAPQFYQVNISQQPVLSMEHKAKQDVLYNTAVSVASAGDTSSQASDHLVHESPKENSGKLPGFVSKEGTLESSPMCDQLRQIDSRLENLGVRPSEVVIDNERMMPPAENLKQEDIMDNRAHQNANREPCIDNAFNNPQMVLDGKYCKQNEMHNCPSDEVPYSHNGIPCSYEVAQPLLGIDPIQGTERASPSGELKDNTSLYNPSNANDVDTIRIDGNSQYYISPANKIGDVQDNSNSLFSSQDPWNLRHDTHFPPPRPNKILTRKEAHNRDPFGENRFGNIGESPSGNILGFASELLPDDGVQTSKGSEEEHIKQELQAVAEGVAASVLHTSTHSVSASDANQDGVVQNNDMEFMHANKVEDTKSKLPEKANLGFPVSDGIGRLQIIKNSDLEELRELGSGTFGTVYYGKWRGSDVAIKRINDRCFAGKPSEEERMRDDFWNEAVKLADLHHPNVVAFYGVVLDVPGGSVATVTEYMVNGSLRTTLLKNEKNLDKRKRLLIAMDAAFGMEYLHGKNIVHFDLKSDNLLVNLRDPHRPICKVGDLGLSKVKCQTLISGGVRGTLPWMAPELLNGSSSLVSEKVDVFSFGIVLWELLTGEEPYQDLHYGAIIGGIVSNSLRPPVPEFCDPEWRLLMERCWSAEPSERPNFTEVANQLRTMAAKVPQKVQAQQQSSSTQPQVKS